MLIGVQCLTDLCQSLMYINANSDVYLGYSSWAAGGFDSTYNLSNTPIETGNGSFTDVPIVSQCVVGTFVGDGIASKKSRRLRRTL